MNGDHCLLRHLSYFNLPCVPPAHQPMQKSLQRMEALLQAIRPLVANPDCHFGSAYCNGSVHLRRTNWLSYQWSLRGWEDPSSSHDCWLIGDGPYLEGHGRNLRECSGACLCPAYWISAASTLAGRKIWQVGTCHGAGKRPCQPNVRNSGDISVICSFLAWWRQWLQYLHLTWIEEMHERCIFCDFWMFLHVELFLQTFAWPCMSWRVFWSIWRRTRHVFEVKFVFTISRGFCWIDDEIAEFTACMHSFASQETSSTESFQGDKKSHTTCMYPLCCVVEKSRWHVCRGFACFWVFVAGWRQYRWPYFV